MHFSVHHAIGAEITVFLATAYTVQTMAKTRGYRYSVSPIYLENI